MDTDKILMDTFISNHPIQSALAIESLDDEHIVAFMEEMPLPLNVKLISQMKTYRGASCLQLMKTDLARALIEEMDIVNAESLLRNCEIPFRTKLLEGMLSKRSKVLSQQLEYRADSVGVWMTPRVFALNEDAIVMEAIEMVKLEKESVSSVIYVINEEDKLVGNIRLSELFFANQTTPLAAIMDTEIPKVLADVPIKSMQDHDVWYEYLTIPVVDRSGKLIGELNAESCKKSKVEVSNELNKEALDTGTALGELYRIGIRGFLQSLSR